MVHQIALWLDSERDYAAGVALYEQHGRSAVLRRVFALGETSYNREKLAAALSELLPPPPSPEELEAAQASLRDAWLPLYKEGAQLHAQLEHVEDDNERREMAFRIISLDDQVKQVWEQEKALAGSGQLPAASAAPAHRVQEPATPLEIDQQIRRLSSQISKHKNNPKRAADVAEWTARKEELKTRLQNG